jgi:hypothetical protein
VSVFTLSPTVRCSSSCPHRQACPFPPGRPRAPIARNNLKPSPHRSPFLLYDPIPSHFFHTRRVRNTHERQPSPRTANPFIRNTYKKRWAGCQTAKELFPILAPRPDQPAPCVANPFISNAYRKRGVASSVLPVAALLKRTLLLWRHTPCKRYPTAAPIRISHATQSGGNSA